MFPARGNSFLGVYVVLASSLRMPDFLHSDTERTFCEYKLYTYLLLMLTNKVLNRYIHASYLPPLLEDCQVLEMSEVPCYLPLFTYVLSFFAGILHSVICLVGLFANALSIPVLRSKDLYTSTFNRLLIVLAINDIFYLTFALAESIRSDMEINTGKSLSEALIFASTNTQYDDRLFIELQVQYMKIPSSNLGRTCCVQKLFLTFRTILYTTCFPHVLQKEEPLTKIYLYYQ